MADESDSTSMKARRMSVVVVDDCVDGAQLLGELIEHYGHRVRIAHDATSGLELLDREFTDTIIIDLGLPDMNGCDVAATARERFGQGLRIVLLSGDANPSSQKRARTSGVDQFFVKPLEPSQIVQLLGDRLEGQDSIQFDQFSFMEDPMRNLSTDSAPSILVVEDDDDIRESVIEILVDDGYQAKGVRDGSEAVNLLSGLAQAPDLILLDLKMPNMDGFEFRRWQEKHAAYSRIPVVAFTADGSAMSKAQNLRAAGVVRKPFQVNTLLAVIARVFDANSGRI